KAMTSPPPSPRRPFGTLPPSMPPPLHVTALPRPHRPNHLGGLVRYVRIPVGCAACNAWPGCRDRASPSRLFSRYDMTMRELTPKQIVEELDRYIIGQTAAKRAVAVAIRNRWCRR